MKEQKEHYELAMIISGTTSETEHPKILSEIKEVLEKYQGEISNQTDLGRRKLAYPIQHLKHGFYQVWELDIEPRSLVLAEKELRINKNILRYLILCKKALTGEEIAKEKQRQESRAKAELKSRTAAAVPEKAVKTKNQGKVSLEDLDKKLDELLDEKVI